MGHWNLSVFDAWTELVTTAASFSLSGNYLYFLA